MSMIVCYCQCPLRTQIYKCVTATLNLICRSFQLFCCSSVMHESGVYYTIALHTANERTNRMAIDSENISYCRLHDFCQILLKMIEKTLIVKSFGIANQLFIHAHWPIGCHDKCMRLMLSKIVEAIPNMKINRNLNWSWAVVAVPFATCRLDDLKFTFPDK